jgi:PAS domain S-box-containing protein
MPGSMDDTEKTKAQLLKELRRLRQQTQRLKKKAAERDRAENEMKTVKEFLENIFKTAGDGLVVTDARGHILKVNKAMCAMTGHSEKELLGRTFEDFSPRARDPKNYPPMIRNLLKGRGAINHETEYKKKDGTVFSVEVNVSSLMDRRGALTGTVSTIRDVTVRKNSEALLLRREGELAERNINLEEVNTALKVLLQKREEDRRALEANMLLNVMRLIHPYLEKIRQLCTGDRMRLYIAIIEENLKEIVSPFSSALSAATLKLTLTEIQVANHIKAGLATSEIARLMGISPGTVEFHRKNIRRKLGLQKTQTNLKAYLKSLS